MRCKFNKGRYWQRLQAGEFIQKIKKSRHPTPESAGQVHCTSSQEVFYIDAATGREIARIHQYLRPDGSLGGSGKPDPKRLFHNGILYALKTPQPEDAGSWSKLKRYLHFNFMRVWGPIRCQLLSR